MFQNFKSNFLEFASKENPIIPMKGIPFKYSELLVEFGGKSFDNGLYTIHTFKDSLKWTGLLSHYFGKFKDEIISFGHDWMGRQFCVPTRSNECILVFDPATQEDFFIDENLIFFHNNILVEDKIDFLALDTFEEVCAYLKADNIEYNQCIGYKQPLFLNGNQDVSNYEIGDLEMFWDFEFQLYQQVKTLPEGTTVNNIVINPFSSGQG